MEHLPLLLRAIANQSGTWVTICGVNGPKSPCHCYKYIVNMYLRKLMFEIWVAAYRDETKRIHFEIRHDIDNLVLSDELKLKLTNKTKQNINILIISNNVNNFAENYHPSIHTHIPPLLKRVRVHGLIAQPSLLFQLWTVQRWEAKLKKII